MDDSFKVPPAQIAVHAGRLGREENEYALVGGGLLANPFLSFSFHLALVVPTSPKGARQDKKESVLEQIPLPPPRERKYKYIIWDAAF